MPDLERLPVEEAYADEEGVGARAPRETGRLGIEIDEPWSGRRDSRARQERQRRVGHRAGRVEKLASVEMAGLEAPSHHEHAPLARLLDGELKFPAADFDLRVASALAFAATLPGLDLEVARFRNGELPFRPIVRIDPIAEAVFVRRGFVAQHHAVRCGVAGQEREGT